MRINRVNWNFFFIFLAFAIMGFTLKSCKDPVANFEVYSKNYWTFDSIYFYNYSTDAYSFNWNMGDSSISLQRNPIYMYSRPGTYVVELTAYSKNNYSSDKNERTINISQPTDLILKIVNYLDTAQLIDNCIVALYDNIENYKILSSWIRIGRTDQNGHILFRDLQSSSYYVDVYKLKDDNGNYFSNKESGYLLENIKPNQINYYIVQARLYKP